MATRTPILILNNINKSFSGVQVLHDISMDIYSGEVHCLVGENGAGKSTLIKILSGAYRLDSGTITYQNQLIHKLLTPHWARWHGINVIYQEVDLVPALSVAENIFLGNESLNMVDNIDWINTRKRAKELLSSIEVELDLKAPVGSLKVAHQQMIAIAKALSLNSKVLILDEPTAVFSGSEVDLLFKLISRLKSQGIAIIYISHHLEEIFKIGDRISVLRDGHLITTGTIDKFDEKSLVKAMVGRDIVISQRVVSLKPPGEELLRVEGLSRARGFENIHFSLHRGEIIGLAGLVGAGRTEVARSIVGADPIDQGEIFIRGQKRRIKSPQKALELGMGMVPENRKVEGLVQVRPVIENISYSVIQSTARFGIVTWKRIRALASKLITDLDVRPTDPQILVRFLSGGNQQKVVLAKLLAAHCEVLILDEPTRGVDVNARAEIYKLIQKLKEEGKAILMISSDLTEILTQADRILVMAKGRIVGELSNTEATGEKILGLALQIGGNTSA